jgi:glutamate-1-semialdehyde 2,1-aminomutase
MYATGHRTTEMQNKYGLPQRSPHQTERVAAAYAAIPGGTTNSLTQPEGLEFLIERGEGVYVYDIDGRRYLDFMLGAGPLILGHAHPRIVETINRKVTGGTQYFGISARAVELAERIIKYVPSAEMVRFASSGTEATMHAIRLARAVTGRAGVIKFDGAWHGHHDLAVWSMELSPTQIPRPYPVSAGMQRGIEDDLVILPYNDANAVKEMMRANPGRFAAIICEPAQRTLSPLPGFLETLREECDRAGTVLIFDEVVTGFRVAPGGAQEKYGVTPDLTALGKALSGGLPLSAIVGKRQFMEHMTPGSDPKTFDFHCGTYNGHPLAIECAHTTMDILVNEGGIKDLATLGENMRGNLARTFRDLKIPVAITGEGPVFHFYITDGPVRDHAAVRRTNLALSDKIHRQLYAAGVYKQFSKGYLSIVHTQDHIDTFNSMLAWAARAAIDGAN